MSDWQFPSTHQFEKYQAVVTNETWPDRVEGLVIRLGQRTTKNKKGEAVFDCNSYLVIDEDHKIHYFLEQELQVGTFKKEIYFRY